MVGWGRARTCAGLVVEAVILGSPGFGLEVEIGGCPGKESALRQVPTPPVDELGGDARRGERGAEETGRVLRGSLTGTRDWGERVCRGKRYSGVRYGLVLPHAVEVGGCGG